MSHTSRSGLLDDVRIVLLRPRWARNLGSVARAMKNFGLQRLILVDSCVGKWAKAYQMAVKADDVLEAATSTDDLAAALAPARWVVATTDSPPAGMRVLTPRQVAAEAVERGAPTLLFGGEINGLHREEMRRCHAVSVIPTAPEQSSINLAQAVCLYAAELFNAYRPEPAPTAVTDAADVVDVVDVVDVTGAEAAALASTDMLQRLELALRHLLETSSWNDGTRPKDALATLMQPFYRARLTDAEVNGWLVAFRKAAWRSPG